MAGPTPKDAMAFRCYAKVNLVLKVVGKRPDGYHDIDSLMQTVDLADTLRLEWGGEGLAVTCSDPTLQGEENLAWKAAKLFLDSMGIEEGVQIFIEKKIPLAAGLGGGSSDAACVLNALAERYGPLREPERLIEMALTIGSDVPYLLFGGLSRVRGRGEDVQPVVGPGTLDLVVCTPDALVRSSWAYGRLRLALTDSAERRSISSLDSALADIESLASALQNDLEKVVSSSFPAVRHLKERMIDLGAMGAVMSGSGPTVLAVVSGRAQAEKMAEVLAADGHKAFAVRTTDFAHSACD